MHIEERLDELESKVDHLTKLLEKQQKYEEWATPEQVAGTLKVGTDTIYKKIRQGQIIADRSTGRIRVPMSQFSAAPELEKREYKTKLQQLIFGDD